MIPAASITMPNIVETFDPEMQELYQAAQGYMESGKIQWLLNPMKLYFA